MFKISKSVPEIYMKESRDFQIFPRLDDLLFLGQHYNINSITELNNPKKCNNTYLKYLAEKVGFYTNEYIPNEVLINIISAFKTAVKNKGTEKGIKQAVYAVLKAENTTENIELVHVKGLNELDLYYEQYCINIYTPIKILNKIALKEFLKYIIPAGYTYNIYTYEAFPIEKVSETQHNDIIGLVKATNLANLSVLRNKILYNDAAKSDIKYNIYNNNGKPIEINNDGSGNKLEIGLLDRLIGSIDSGIVPNTNEIKEIIDIDNNNGFINENVNTEFKVNNATPPINNIIVFEEENANNE